MFIETGTHDGDGCAAALAAGYEEVYSIEAGRDLYAQCIARFKDDARVHVVFGGSEVEFGRVLDQVREPATVWLDAHSAFGDMPAGTNLAPLLRELDALAGAPVRMHTVLVDDVRLFPILGTSLEEVCDQLRRVNSAYKLDVIDGNYFKQDVLVASL